MAFDKKTRKFSEEEKRLPRSRTDRSRSFDKSSKAYPESGNSIHPEVISSLNTKTVCLRETGRAMITIMNISLPAEIRSGKR